VTASIIEELNNFVTDGAIASAVAFSMQADIPSGPLAFDVSNDLRKAHILSSVHSNSGARSRSAVPLIVVVEIGW